MGSAMTYEFRSVLGDLREKKGVPSRSFQIFPQKGSGGYYLIEAILIVPIGAILIYGAVALSHLSRLRIQRQALSHLISLIPADGGPEDYRRRVEAILKTKYRNQASCESTSSPFGWTCNAGGFTITISAPPLMQSVTVEHPSLKHHSVSRGYLLWPY
jgi:hypothetical protein